MKRIVILLLAIQFLSMGLCKAQDQATNEEVKSRVLWTAQEFRLINKPDEIVEVLSNGMTAIVKENHTAPVSAVRLYVRAGSIYEGEHLGAGLSHLFEHLLAGGSTSTRTEEESRKMREQIGARFNANTGKARTCYFLTVPAQHVGTALNLIADWVTRPLFPENEFNREWAVVQRELEMGATDPYRQMWYLFDELRYIVHPGRFPVIGYQSIVQQLTRKEVIDYYHLRYIPDNCVVLVVGDINAEEMLSAIKSEFADFTRRANQTIVLPSEPEVTAPRELIKVFPAMQGPARMNIGFPTIVLQHDDLYALDTLANIMGEGESSRLYRRLREEEQLVLSIYTASYTPSWAEGTFTILCELDPDNVAATQEIVWEEIEAIINEGVAPEELLRAKRQLQVEHIRSNQTAEQQASTMGEDFISTGDPHFSDHYVENMQRVTADQVQEMARKYLNRQKQLTLVLTPRPLKQAKEEELLKAGDSAIQKITLSNGLRVLLKRNTAVPLVNVQFYVLGGLLDETQANNGITNLMADLSTKGTEDYDAEEIIDYFDGIGGTISAGSGNHTYYYRTEMMKHDFEEAFNIFSEIVMQPSFPQEELDKLRTEILAEIRKVKNSWPAEGARFFRESFFVNSPYQRTSLGVLDSVASLTREQIIEFHKKTTVGKRGVLAIFGDIDMEATEKLVRDKFSQLPEGDILDLDQFMPEPVIDSPRQFIQETQKNGATVHVGFPGMKLTNVQERYPMEVLTEIIGSETGWLHELLRGRGLVYYAWGFSFGGLVPGYIAATAQCEADKAPEVVNLIKEQLARTTRGEITEEEVNRAKSKLINSEILNKQTNADMAMTAALDELYGFGYNWSEGHADRILVVTLADVQNVAKKYLSGPSTVTINTSQPELFMPAGDEKDSEP